MWAIIQNFKCPEVFLDDIWQPFAHKKWEGHLLEREHLLEYGNLSRKGICFAPITYHCVQIVYRNDLKFSDRQVSANSADPDQILIRVFTVFHSTPPL